MIPEAGEAYQVALTLLFYAVLPGLSVDSLLNYHGGLLRWFIGGDVK